MIKTKKQSIGANCTIAESATIECEELILGDGVFIGERVRIKAKKIIIDDFSLIGADTNINIPYLTVGEYTKIHNHALINGKEAVHIGHNCWIGQNCILNGEALLCIGNNVGIGTYSSIWTHGYFGQLIDGCNYCSIKPTTIENDAWLVGSYNTIFPGVTIGEKAVVMGTSVITKNIPKGHTFGGNPAIDITEKLKPAYTPIPKAQQKQLLKETLITYFQQNNMYYQTKDANLHIEGYGQICFDENILPTQQDTLYFLDCVSDWNLEHQQASLFCLTSKKYKKTKKKLEVLVRKILNPCVARFIPFL